MKKNEMDGVCGLYERQERCLYGCGGDNWVRERLEDLGINGRVILIWIFKNWDGEAWTGRLWLRTGTGGRLLWMQQ